jgi:DNA-binding PadR family transcriptional regulator
MAPRMPRPKKEVGFWKGHPHGFAGPHGAPRGFLRLYILHRIAEKPSHGYDILREIASKTEGSWRPGAGSIYPILKELVAEGLIRPESQKKAGTSQRIYDITPEGRKFLEQFRDIPEKMSRGWGSMRRIFIELVDPQHVPKIFASYISGQFDFARELLESKQNKIPESEVKYMLREYALNLERQLDWTNRVLKKL